MSLDLDIYLSKIFPTLPSNEISEICSNEPLIRSWCRNEQFWQNLTLQYYPEAGIKPATLSWFEFYIETFKFANAIRHVYPRASPKPTQMSYAKYYQLLSQAKNTRRY